MDYNTLKIVNGVSGLTSINRLFTGPKHTKIFMKCCLPEINNL
ncbi:hypothetical protein BH23BAC3_BH23BAC3_06150 [soil metagenome]